MAQLCAIISRRIYNCLLAGNVTTIDKIKKASPQDLMSTGLSELDVEIVYTQVSKSSTFSSTAGGYIATTWLLPNLMELSVERITLGCEKLDSFLGGGVEVARVTEVLGSCDDIKTMLCIQLSLAVQYLVSMGGLDGGAVYLTTTGLFKNSWLSKMASVFTPWRGKLLIDRVLPADRGCGDSIYVNHLANEKSMMHCLGVGLPALLQQENVKLVVVDSIDGQNSSAVLELLEEVATRHNVAVLCVNREKIYMYTSVQGGSSGGRQEDGHRRVRISIEGVVEYVYTLELLAPSASCAAGKRRYVACRLGANGLSCIE